MSARVGDPAFNPEFRTIDINVEDVARELQKFVERGSSLTGVELSDINLTISSGVSDVYSASPLTLLKHGAKLFDLLIWITAGKPKDHAPEEDPTIKDEKIPTLQSIADAVFYCYFFLLTQARYPATSSDNDPPKVPNFLTKIMSLDEKQHVYAERLCSFKITKFDPRWIRYVELPLLGQESVSRFGLGVAGYRMFAPFKVLIPKPNLPENLQSAYEYAKDVAESPPSWNVHPVTRAPGLLTERGNLNQNLGNLMLEVFTAEQLKHAKEIKMIYDVPKHQPNHTNYRTWSRTSQFHKDDLIAFAKK